MRLYEDSGYLNFEEIFNKTQPLVYIVGARGTGKTYGVINYCVRKHIKFLYIRRTQVQLDACVSSIDPGLNPFYQLNIDNDWELNFKKVNKQVYGIFDRYDKQEDPNTGEIEEPTLVGYSLALSTFRNIKSFGFDVGVIIFDEFIADYGDTSFKGDEAGAFMKLLESLNRNRELDGRPMIKTICMANSDDVRTPLFRAMNLIRVVMKLTDKKTEYWADPKRGISIIMPWKSKIAAMKKQSMISKLFGEDSAYVKASYGNEFMNNDFSGIKSLDLKQLKPVLNVGEIGIYVHKQKDCLYVSPTFGSGVETIGATEIELQRFKQTYNWMWVWYLTHKDGIWFEDYISKALFIDYNTTIRKFY